MLADGADDAGRGGRRPSATSRTPRPTQRARRVDATYEVPYLAHACMEPMNCTAWVQGDAVEIWAGTQSQGPDQGILARWPRSRRPR